jgi:hypothetical protein
MVEVITIAKFGNFIEANLAQQDLEAEGIMAFLADETTINMAWHFTVAVGGIRLQVPEPEVEQAMTILYTTRVPHKNAFSNTFDLTLDEPLASAQEEEAQIIPDSEEDDDPVRVSWADRTVERMFRTAVIGLSVGLLPLHLYSFWLLIRLLVSFRRVTRSEFWKVIVTVMMISPTIMIAILLFY